MYTSTQIKKELDNAQDIAALSEFCRLYENDERKSVIKFVETARKKIQAIDKEEKRLNTMCETENGYYKKGVQYIAGVDEVGRGPLAGPVLTAAVILPKGFKYPGINDSKKLSKSKREELCEVIKKNAVAIGINLESNTVIDEMNILSATKLSMKKSLEKLSVKPDIVLVDAVTIPNIDIKQEAIIKGDAKSISIAAASIVAKVARDKIMEEFAAVYPEYGFDHNSGYGTAEHIAAIKEHGICPIHRKSFLTEICNTEN